MTEEQRRELDERGYVVVEGVLGEGELRELRAAVEGVFEAAGENAGHELRRYPHERRVENVDARGEAFRRLAGSGWLGEGFVPAGLTAVSVNPYAPVGEAMAAGDGAWRVVWLLDDFGSGSGALRVAPGSHKEDERGEEVELTGAAGSVVVMDGGLWRGGTPNGTERHKRRLEGVYGRRG